MAKTKEDIEMILKKLEGVYKTTSNPVQRERVFKEICEVKKILESIPEDGIISDKDSEVIINLEENFPNVSQEVSNSEENKSEENKETTEQTTKKYETIADVKIKPLHPLCNNDDVNFLATMFNEFEDEYWGAISDYHLDLDYNHSNKRDTFFNKLENNKRLIKELIKIYEQMEHTTRQEFKAQLQSMANKQERTFIIEAVNYFYALRDFLILLVENYDSNGNIILNADDIIKFEKLYGEKKLSGLKVIDAVKRTLLFLNEVLDFINLPNLYKKSS